MNHDLGNYNPCEHKRDFIDEAGKMVGLDFKNPIDCSQMQVHNIQAEPVYHDDGRIKMIRKATLFAYVFNDKNEQEELTIDFTLKSQRLPKL